MKDNNKNSNKNEVVENNVEIVDVNENEHSKEEDKNKAKNESKTNSYYYKDSDSQYPKKKLNTFSLIGFISSLVFFIPFITDIIGLVFSILGLKETSRKNEAGRGFAIAGIIISSIRILFTMFILAISIYIIAENGFHNGFYDDDFHRGFNYHYFD